MYHVSGIKLAVKNSLVLGTCYFYDTCSLLLVTCYMLSL